MPEEKNALLKQAQRIHNTPTWRLAELVGCSETTMFRRLRHELPPDVQKQYIELIVKNSEVK